MSHVNIAPRFTKTFYLENPLTGDSTPGFYTQEPLTVLEVRGVIIPQTPPGTPLVSFEIRFAPDRDAAGLEVNSTPLLVSSTAAGQAVTITTAAIPANSHVWMEIVLATTLLDAPAAFEATLTAVAS